MEELKAVISLLQEELKEEESSREVEEGVGFVHGLRRSGDRGLL
jgi:hypothetical protein|tara:strand:- start:337 stop:468 length:132 start_codon:yes stop_codon:yes gene_type:complete